MTRNEKLSPETKTGFTVLNSFNIHQVNKYSTNNAFKIERVSILAIVLYFSELTH